MTDDSEKSPVDTPPRNAFTRMSERMGSGASEIKSRERLTKEVYLEKRSARQKAVDPEKRQSTLRMIGAGALVVGIGAMIATMSISIDGFKADTARNDALIESLEERIAIGQRIVDADIDTGPVVEEIRNDVAAAYAAGERLVSLQNELNRLSYVAVGETPISGDGSPLPSMVASIDVRKQIAEMFAEQTFVLDENVAYSYASNLGLSPTEMDPRLSWFTASDASGGVFAPSAPEAYPWVLEAVDPLLGSDRVFEVMLVNQSPDGTLYAWAHTLYNAEEGKFVSLEVTTTIFGDSAAAGKGL